MRSGPDTLISEVRAASRDLVRHLGLLNKTIAGTDLSVSAVHALIEIGQSEKITAKGLSHKLLLEKSTVSRLIKSLLIRGEITETRSGDDSRFKIIQLTQQGCKTLESIEGFAQLQVSSALKLLDKESREIVLKGLREYSSALQRVALADNGPEDTTSFKIIEGYAPTLIGRILEMFLYHMNRSMGFGSAFETRVASDIAEFINRIDHPGNQIWRVEKNGKIAGSIAIDGVHKTEGYAHLRWFIVSEAIRGQGAGQALLKKALDFCDSYGYPEIHLWTVKGLDTARALYEKFGFQIAEQYVGNQWGKNTEEQKFIRYRP